MDAKKQQQIKKMNRFAARVFAEQARIAPKVPGIDPHDLNLILARMLRPVKDRCYFHRRVGDRYVR